MKILFFFLTPIFLTACAVDAVSTMPREEDKDKIHAVVESHLEDIKKCHEADGASAPHGKVIITWVIGEKGDVLNSQIKSSTFNSPALENCIVSNLKNWKFPSPPSGETATVNFPFRF